MRCMKRTLFGSAALLLATATLLGQNQSTRTDVSTSPLSPATHLGRAVGTDFKLADWSEVSSYYRKLAENTRTVKVETLGKTTEGRDFLMVTISSPENLAKLATLKSHARTLADPRGKTPTQKQEALRDGKVFLVITPSMHSTEVGATEMGMQLAWELATSEEEPFKSARQNAVIFITPTLNPDGLDHVVTHYRSVVGTPFESSSMNKLYQYYTGHDNNRDWFMMTQAETRLLSKFLYTECFPQILWDVHQQGNGRERFFTPPYRDPLNPNVDPAVVAGINLIGTRAVMDMNAQGLTGIATGSTYDMWWHGGNRSTPARHNVIGILTEAASADLASPIFQLRSSLKSSTGDVPYGPSVNMISPWPGGWWRVGDIVKYELAFGRSLLGTINREPDLWKQNMLSAAERAVAATQEGVQYWILPSDNRDPSAVRRMVEALMLAGIEVHTVSESITAHGRTYPAGSIVIRRDQPFGAHVKDLFELQKYPEGKAPYDVAGWTLPLLMGVHRVEVSEALDAKARLRPAKDAKEAIQAFGGAEKLDDGQKSLADSASWTELAKRLAAGETVTINNATTLAKEPKGASTVRLNKLPRIGVYAPHTGVMSEGWLRYVLDLHQIPFATVKNEALRAGDLRRDFDVILFADMSETTISKGRAFGATYEHLTGGLSPEGSVALQQFVQDGGNLITLGAASNYAIKLFQLPVSNALVADDGKAFSCPGSVLRSVPVSHPLTANLPPSIPLFFSDDLAFTVGGKGDKSAPNVQTLLRYAPTELLLSGYIAKPAALEGQAAWVRAEVGNGKVHLFGFSPHFRAWTQGTIPLLFRAMFLDVPTIPSSK